MGSGSSVQDFVDEFMMISLVVSGVIVEKFVNMLEHNCVGMLVGHATRAILTVVEFSVVRVGDLFSKTNRLTIRLM